MVDDEISSLFVLSIVESGVLNSPNITVGLSSSPFISLSFCIILFGALLSHVQTFRIAM